MNNENNNLENNFGSESLGSINPNVNAEPINNEVNSTFNPFQDLNNAPLNVPTESLNDQSIDQNLYSAPDAAINASQVAEPVVNSMPQTDSTFNSMQANNVDSLNDMLNPEPLQNVEPVQPVETFDFNQSAPVVDSLNEQPVMDQTYNEQPSINPNMGLGDYVNQTTQIPTVETPVQEGPTMPIPDQMLTNDYQAGVSTPVDYATPMSDFDQIGTTPELDPKAKGNKKGNKLIPLILLLLVIACLGGACYYFINVKGILNSDSVSVKEVTFEKGEALSTNIDDYATFKNTSSSNCVLDTSKVNIALAGSYDFTVSCGEKSYTGKVIIKDTKGPEIEAKTNIITAGTSLTADMLVASSSEDATYAYASDAELENYQTAGLKFIKINATDTNSNAKTHIIPVIVTSSEYSFAIVSKKNVSNDNVNATVIEKNAILFNNGGGQVNDTSYTAYVITFNDASLYKDAIKGYDNSGNLTYETYSGTPVFYASSNTLVLVKDINSDLIKEDYNTTFTNLRDNLGYETVVVSEIAQNKQLLDFNGR